MTISTVFAALDSTLELRTHANLSQLIGHAYRDLVAPPGTTAQHTLEVGRLAGVGPWRESFDGAARIRRRHSADVLSDVRQVFNEVAERSVAATHTVLNASAIEIGGMVVVMIGGKTFGKSSLTLTAAQRGHGFVADDVVAITDTGVVRPFHRPLGIRLEAAPKLGVAVPPGPFEHGYPMALGQTYRLSQGGPLGLIALIAPGDDTITEPVQPSWALMYLTEHAVRASGHERAMFRRCETLVRKVPAIQLWHHDPARAIDHIEAAIARISQE